MMLEITLIAKGLGEKSLESIKGMNFLTVYEGAVRSTKTVTSLIKWYYTILKSPDNVFLMSGNTMGSISRNCINGDFGFIAITGNKATAHTDTDGSKYLQLGKKRIYYCGADNERSFKKIRGMSIGGWYADEVDLHSKSFVETALARSFAATYRVNVWTLNPNSPGHWIYSEYLDKYAAENTCGYKYYHFTLDDNPIFTEQRKNEIKAQFSGVFYKRYVLGLRVRAEGGCYPSFNASNIIDVLPENILSVQIGVDIGGNTSATVFTATGFYVGNKQINVVVVDEFYDDKNKSTESVLANFKAFVLKIQKQYKCADVYFESAEQLLRKSCINMNIANIHNSIKGTVVDRIRITDLLMSTGRLSIMSHCKYLIQAFENAVWDPKSNNLKRLDNGTSNIDSLDSFEYSYSSMFKTILPNVILGS